MIFGFASKTFSPTQSGHSEGNLPSSWTGSARGMPDVRGQGNARRAAELEVVLAEARRHVHDPGALRHVDEGRPEHAERAELLGEEREERAIAAPHQLAAEQRRHALRAGQLLLVLRR